MTSLGGLEGSVAARAVPSPKHLGLRTEDMARVAIHGHAIEVNVGQRGLILVALRARAGIRVLKAFFGRVVTFVAFEAFVDDVLRMSGRKTDTGPAIRHRAGGPRRPLLLHRRDHVRREPCEKEPA